MTLSIVRPVGEPIQVPESFDYNSIPRPPGYNIAFFPSGTAALAAALSDACSRVCYEAPEVVVPGFGCPDLVAAAIFAGVTPVLADTRPNSPFLDMDDVKRKLGPSTVCVIGAHFWGLREDLDSLARCLDGTEIAIIEDSAQCFPSSCAGTRGQYIVHSLGRGKPGGALGGGILQSNRPIRWTSPGGGGTVQVGPVESFGLRGRLFAHRLLLTSLAYGVLSRIPGLDIGTTRYRRLKSLDGARKHQILAAIAGLGQRSSASAEMARSAVCHELKNYLPTSQVFFQLATVPETANLTRFPLLVRHWKSRDVAVDILRQYGIGASPMYCTSLADMDDVPGVDSARTPVADDFSRRLFTVPVNTGMTSGAIGRLTSGIVAAERALRPG